MALQYQLQSVLHLLLLAALQSHFWALSGLFSVTGIHLLVLQMADCIAFFWVTIISLPECCDDLRDDLD